MEILFNFKNSKSDPLNKFIEDKHYLLDLKTNDIIEVLNEISKYWLSNNCNVRNLFIQYEMGFLIGWLKKNNQEKLLKINFKNFLALDNPLDSFKEKIIYYARPRGIALHWLAGNVPVLGIISVFQTILTKNKSIVKVPQSFKNILPIILKDLKNNKYFKKNIQKKIDIILRSIIVIYVNKSQIQSIEKLSKIADIRIPWGGAESIHNILKLPKKINCKDIVFGPKVSICLVKKELLQNKKNLKKLSKLVCDDIIPFNQMGCNSPHNLIIESGSRFKLKEIAEAIDREFNLRNLNSKFINDPLISFNIVSKKLLYQINDKKMVISSDTKNWNIFINNSDVIEIEKPLYKNSLFVSKISNLKKLYKILPNNIQSIGLFCKPKDKKKIIKLLADTGADRFPDIGKMSLYQNPWDGYLPMQEMVRWVSGN